MTMHIPANKNTEHSAAQVPAPDRFLHPTLGPLVAREAPEDYCIDFQTGAKCEAFHRVCPTHYGGPQCQPAHRPDGKPIIWVSDPAYVK